ncbi:putative ATP-grasp-modified RiPP [Kitasatospora sp. NPDC005751]|uniref:putative ATP-grasp-modified RiPP n=1 Tax=Kitasatospora sp. NPDC005751 TaxID=3157064 RepID=UPI0033EA912B
MLTVTTERGSMPFGARAAQPPYTVRIDPAEFAYDPDRQVNVVNTDGSLWAKTPVAASSTGTNNDSTGPVDETSDPYAFPGDEVA